MPVKFNQYWTIDRDKVDDYKKFVIRKYIPGMNNLGIHVVAGWTVLIGGAGEIILEGVSNDLDMLERALRDPNYKKLNGALQSFIHGYRTKVLVSTGTKDAYTRDVKKDTVKFSQVWDIVSGKDDAYRDYVTRDFYPCLEAMGLQIAREWEVLIGDGPRIICEGRTMDIDSTTLISNLQGKTFQEAKQGLKQVVEHYECRILIFHIQKIVGYKSASYEFITY